MKLRSFFRLLLALALLLVLGLYATAFQVMENEQAVVTRFGQPVRTLDEPGLYFRWPWPVEAVRRFDMRLVFQDMRLAESLTRDKRNVVVPLFVAWRIESPLRFLESLGGPQQADRMLENMVISAQNTVLSQFDLDQLVSTIPGRVRLQDIEQAILARVAPAAERDLGVRIEEIGIRRISLPEANTPAVFERMRAERAQFASKFRAEGRKRADEIRVQAESEATLLLAEARAEAETLRGEAEAQAARIYAAAYATNPGLYQFLRRLQTLQQVADGHTTLVLDAAGSPFDLLDFEEKNLPVEP